jgi:hypothetical protein
MKHLVLQGLSSPLMSCHLAFHHPIWYLFTDMEVIDSLFHDPIKEAITV